ncbi:hypothetical protein BOX15_Mlig014895g4 [Macrostomum lignano]|uniref:EF-hand domain-containing protein n=2 Tax=Macrostomum lignano TaxID=282301 RepID=A0A1I8GUE0_9PLAT|nr:hypothetical protein BOX15_Mlig014895g3 [Macrostomum lignano]PAA54648.1 hypothetical protein BOX15_Mlig014895g2 [Macrostomum lignano]PAA67287.1 hypothetical protein BOX15_Mlig014895g1 [Macrostomum lignano]PAA80857.1 hypothetical protein BOX15_Mlig014895g4 [Macrostomum lignano]
MADSDAQLKAVFSYFDRDGTGKLDVNEIQEVLNALGQCMTPDEIKEIMQKEDINSDGAMDIKEFISFFKKYGKEANKISREIRDAFKKFDKQGRGYLTQADLEKILTQTGAFPFSKEEAEMCFKAFDTNKDGKMDYEEFANFLCAICPSFDDLEKLNNK